MVPDTLFIIILKGKITARKSILLIIHVCSKRGGPNLCPFILYSFFSNRFQNCQDTYSVKYPVPNSYGIFVPIIETKNCCRMELTAKIATIFCGKPMVIFREETTDEIWVIILCSLFGQEYIVYLSFFSYGLESCITV